MPHSRIEALKEGIHDFEKRHPQFLNPNYQPNSEDAEEHKKYLTLKGELDRAYSSAAVKLFQDKANEDRVITDRILAQNGPLPEVIGQHILEGETRSHSAASAVKQTRTAAGAAKGFVGLGQKMMDLSKYFDAADLTERQRECASMRWEYDLSARQIALRLGLHHKTVQESLAATTRRLERDANFQRALKKRKPRRGSHEESD